MILLIYIFILLILILTCVSFADMKTQINKPLFTSNLSRSHRGFQCWNSHNYY